MTLPCAPVDLDRLQQDAVGYFLRAANPDNGLVADSTRADAPCSIAATGLGLACWVVAAERGYLTRREAAARTLATLRFLRDSPQGEEEDATGHQGFYYHFLDLHTGRRAWDSELSMMDTAILVAGALTGGSYFSGAGGDEEEIRTLGRFLYERIDWPWATAGNTVLSMGWKPGTGFLRYSWEGYSEALLLYVLGLGSPSSPLSPECYRGWTRRYQWEDLYGVGVLYGAPLFVHQLSHVWLDLRGIRDAFMREKRSAYFENSRRAITVQQRYAVRNPRWFAGYGEHCWGITACEGPGFTKQPGEGGVERQFYGYVARGVPFGPDDGTLAPWAVAASLPFAPETVLATLGHVLERYPEALGDDGLLATFNPSFDTGEQRRWRSPHPLGLDQGPVALMIENHRTGLTWRVMRACPAIRTGLRRAGFRGGWLARSVP
jgi:hypothetical protein